MPPPPLLLDRRDHVVTLTLNRPEQRNALAGEELFALFEQHCGQINADPQVRCVILTGAGPAFCAGGDVKQMRDRAGMFAGSPGEIRDQYQRAIQRIPRALWELEVPAIAAVNGPAIGAGLDLACMCDIRIASDTATFAESFIELGLIPGDGGAWLLPRIVGLPRASELAFTGARINAEQALADGLVSSVVAPSELQSSARGLAAQIAAHPPQALRWTKRLLREGLHSELPAMLQISGAFQAMAHHTRDHQEALDAIFQKRPPDYQGR